MTEENSATPVLAPEVLKQQILDNVKRILPGKSPVRLFTKENKIDWKNAVVREPFETCLDAIKFLTATSDGDIAGDIVHRGVIAQPNSNRDIAESYNIAFQALADYAPKDAIEARLCLQANALYSQGMQYLSNAADYDMIPQREFSMKNAMKLLRLHNETVEALCKYRRGGEHRVVVQHVSVNDGGKAIVSGQMVAGGGGLQQKNDEVTPC